MQWILVLITDALAGKAMSSHDEDPQIYVLLDHEERIPLFTRAAEKDPDLPYGPLLRCATNTIPSFRILMPSTERLRVKTSSCN